MIQDILWNTYTQLGCQAYSQGKHSFAQRMFIAAMEEAQKNENNQRRIATSLANLAFIYCKQNDKKCACRLFKRAMALYEKLYGKINLGVAKCLDSLAELYFLQGEYVMARRFYKRFVIVIEELMGKEHPLLVDRLITMGVIDASLGQHQRALNYYWRAKSISRKLSP